ncbi:MAG: hypothetical protein Q9225_007266 [Loekoesia sp. 1 TL-2023]
MFYSVAFLIVLGLCSATPAQYEPAPASSGRPSLGFPSQYLPAAASPAAASDHPENPGNDVESPLKPHAIHWLHPQIRYDPEFSQPKGGQLVMSISTYIYYSWIDTANTPISLEKVTRQIPFPNFLYTVSPSLRWPNEFTPFKLGLALCWILESILELPAWPGHIHADIIEDNRGRIGTLEISNSPQAAAMAASQDEDNALAKSLYPNETYRAIARPSPSTNGRSPALAVSDGFERRWFTCLFKMLLYVFAKPSSDRLTEALPPPAYGPNPRTYGFRCVRDGHDQGKVNLAVYPTAWQSRNQATWDSLAKTMLIFGTRVAEDEDGWDTEQLVVTHEGVVTATIRIIVEEGNGASATA